MIIKNITGQKFGRLTALYRLHNNHKKGTYWLCVCECGNLKEVRLNSLTCGYIKSCGCLNSELSKNRATTHSKRNTRLYNVYCAMKQRCYNKNNKAYKNYGERDIKVCDEWLNDFMAFYNWSMENGYKDTLTIDRINVNGNYEPNNCRWVDMKTQQNNRSNNILLTYKGKTKTISQWADIIKVPRERLINRYYRDWSIEDILLGKE